MSCTSAYNLHIVSHYPPQLATAIKLNGSIPMVSHKLYIHILDYVPEHSPYNHSMKSLNHMYMMSPFPKSITRRLDPYSRLSGSSQRRLEYQVQWNIRCRPVSAEYQLWEVIAISWGYQIHKYSLIIMWPRWFKAMFVFKEQCVVLNTVITIAITLAFLTLFILVFFILICVLVILEAPVWDFPLISRLLQLPASFDCTYCKAMSVVSMYCISLGCTPTDVLQRRQCPSHLSYALF
jgi:hypothetical protein